MALIVGLGFALKSCIDVNATNIPTRNIDPTAVINVSPMLDRDNILGSPDEYDQLLTQFDLALMDLERDAYDYSAYLKISEVYMTEARITGQFGYYLDAAEEVLNWVIDQDSPDPDIQYRSLIYLASVELSMHHFAEAKELGKKAVSVNPHNAFGYGVLVDANVELGIYDRAVEMADRMVEIRPDLRSYSRVSYLREIHGDMQGAIEAMEMAVAAGFPGFEETAWTTVQLGTLHEKLGEIKTAAMYYKQARDQRENYAPAIAALAQIELKEGNIRGARALAEQAISIQDDAHYHALLAHIHRADGQKEWAEIEAKKAVDLLSDLGEDTEGHGHSHEVGLEMGRMHLEFTEDFGEVIHNGLHEYDDRPNNVDVNELLAGGYLAKGKLSKAKKHLEMAMSTGKSSAALLCIKGLIAHEEGNSEAVKILESSLNMNPYQLSNFSLKAREIVDGTPTKKAM